MVHGLSLAREPPRTTVSRQGPHERLHGPWLCTARDELCLKVLCRQKEE